jgi:hypothetical protein
MRTRTITRTAIALAAAVTIGTLVSSPTTHEEQARWKSSTLQHSRHTTTHPPAESWMEAQYNLTQWASYTEWLEASSAAVNAQKAQAAAEAAQAVTPATMYGPTNSSPGGMFACIRSAESGGNYAAVNSSSGAGGAYQFMPSTWAALGGAGLPENAPPSEQDAMAQKLYARDGWAPWRGDPCVG